jgi:hypothetical protein
MIHQIISSQNVIDICPDRYRRIISARQKLFEVLAVEEKFALLRQNYAELEQAFLSISLNNLMFEQKDWSSRTDDIQSINRHFINLLSSCRMYVDHAPQHLNKIFGNNSSQSTKFKDQTHKEYDAHLGYRVLYSLRNYVQHSGWPIQSVSYQGSRIETADSPKWCRKITAFLDVSFLEGSSFKKEILAQIKEIGEEIDIKPLLRENIAAFGRIHFSMRDLWNTELPDWEAVLLDVQREYEQQFGSSQVGVLFVIERDELNNAVVSRHSIFTDFMDRRKYLEARNSIGADLNSSYISSESIKP